MTASGIVDDVVIPDHWEGLEGVFGGFILALVAESLPPGPHRLVSCSLRFHARVDLGPIERRIHLDHDGSTTRSVRVELWQRGRRVVSGTLLGVAEEGEATYRGRSERLPASTPGDLLPRIHLQGDLAFDRHLEVRCEPDFTIESGGGCWLRLRSGPADLGLRGAVGGLCVLLDGLMPAPFAAQDPPWFVPTIEFSLTLAPGALTWSGGWAWGTNRTEWMSDRLCSETTTLVDDQGHHLASLRQVRGIRRASAEGRARPTRRSAS